MYREGELYSRGAFWMHRSLGIIMIVLAGLMLALNAALMLSEPGPDERASAGASASGRSVSASDFAVAGFLGVIGFVMLGMDRRAKREAEAGSDPDSGSGA